MNTQVLHRYLCTVMRCDCDITNVCEIPTIPSRSMERDMQPRSFFIMAINSPVHMEGFHACGEVESSLLFTSRIVAWKFENEHCSIRHEIDTEWETMTIDDSNERNVNRLAMQGKDFPW